MLVAGRAKKAKGVKGVKGEKMEDRRWEGLEKRKAEIFTLRPSRPSRYTGWAAIKKPESGDSGFLRFKMDYQRKWAKALLAWAILCTSSRLRMAFPCP